MRTCLVRGAVTLVAVTLCIASCYVEGLQLLAGSVRFSGPLRSCQVTSLGITSGVAGQGSTDGEGDFSLSLDSDTASVFRVTAFPGTSCIDAFTGLRSPFQLSAGLPAGLTSASVSHASSTALAYLELAASSGNATYGLTGSIDLSSASLLRATVSELYGTFNVSLSNYSQYDALQLQPFSMLPSNRSADRNLAVALLGAEAQLSALAHVGAALLSAAAANSSATVSSSIAAANVSALARVVVMAEGMRTLLRLQALRQQLQAEAAAAAAAATAAMSPPPADFGLGVNDQGAPPPPGMSAAPPPPVPSPESVGGLYTADVVMGILNTSAARIGINVAPYAMNSTALVVSGLATYAEGVKRAAIRELSGESLGLNPLNSVIMIARLSAVEFDAVTHVPALVSGKPSALDTYVLDALEERLSKAVVDVSAIHTTLGLPAPAPAAPASGAAHMIGPLRGCTGQSNGIWTPSYEAFTTSYAGALGLAAKGMGMVGVSPYRYCMDGLSQVQLDMSVYNLGPAMQAISVSPVGMLAQGFYMVDVAQRLATLTLANQYSAFRAMRLDMDAYNAFMIVPPSSNATAAAAPPSPPPPSPGTSALPASASSPPPPASTNGQTFNLSHPLMGSIIAANAQLLGIFYMSRALFSRSCAIAYGLENSEDFNDFTNVLTLYGVTAEAVRAGGVLDLSNKPQVNSIFDFVLTVCFFNSSEVETLDNIELLARGVFLSGNGGTAIGAVDSTRRRLIGVQSSSEDLLQQQHRQQQQLDGGSADDLQQDELPSSSSLLSGALVGEGGAAGGGDGGWRQLPGRDVLSSLAAQGVLLGPRLGRIQAHLMDRLSAQAASGAEEGAAGGGRPVAARPLMGQAFTEGERAGHGDLQHQQLRGSLRVTSRGIGGDGASGAPGRRLRQVYSDDPDMVAVYKTVTEILVGINGKLQLVQNKSSAAFASPATRATTNLTELIVTATQLGVVLESSLYRDLDAVMSKDYFNGLALATAIQGILVKYTGAALVTRMNEASYNQDLICSAAGAQCYVPPSPSPSNGGGGSNGGSGGSNISGGKAKSGSAAMYVGISVAAVAGVVLLAVVIWLIRRSARSQQVKRSVVNNFKTGDMGNLNLRQPSTLAPNNPLNNGVGYQRPNGTMHQGSVQGPPEGYYPLVPAALGNNPAVALDYPLYPTTANAAAAGTVSANGTTAPFNLSGSRKGNGTLSGPRNSGTGMSNTAAGAGGAAALNFSLPPPRFASVSGGLSAGGQSNNGPGSPLKQQPAMLPLGFAPPGVQPSPLGPGPGPGAAFGSGNLNSTGGGPPGYKTYPNSAFVPKASDVAIGGELGSGNGGQRTSPGLNNSLNGSAYALGGGPQVHPEGPGAGGGAVGRAGLPPLPPAIAAGGRGSNQSFRAQPGGGLLPPAAGGSGSMTARTGSMVQLAAPPAAAGGGLNGTLGRRTGLPPLVPYTSVTNADAPTATLNSSLRAIPVNMHFNSSLRPPPAPASGTYERRRDSHDGVHSSSNAAAGNSGYVASYPQGGSHSQVSFGV